MKVKSFKRELSIRSQLKNKKNSLQFLPICLEEISKYKDFTYKEKVLKTSYLIDIVHNLILKYYFKKENRFSIMSTILKEKYGYLYNYYINYLLENNIIELLKNYKAGKNARVYKLNDTILKSTIKRYPNSDKVLLKKYKNNVSQIEQGIKNNLIEDDIKLKLVNDLFSIDIDFYRSIFYLDNLRSDDNDIYNKNRYSVECISDKHIFYHFDNYGRMHTNFTILKSFIRKNCLMIDDESTHEIDIKNSQPLFLTKIIIDSKSHWVKNEELELFKYLTINGLFYQYLMDYLKISDKKIAKEITYKVLFGKNSSNSKSDKIFKELFPTIHYFIKLYKKEKGDYKVLAYELQKAESNLIYNKIIKEVMNVYPEIKLVTVHDSIIMSKKWRPHVENIFNKHIIREFDLK
jgi:hypothetical protein